MRRMKKLTSIILSALMLISIFGMTVSAEESATPATPDPITSVPLVKELAMDKYVTEYPALEFSFSFERVEKDALPSYIKKQLGTNIDTLLGSAVTTISDVNVTFAAASGLAEENEGDDTSDGIRTVKSSADIAVSAEMFGNEPGYYVYAVTENNFRWFDSGDKNVRITKDDNITKDTRTLYLVISVARDEKDQISDVDYYVDNFYWIEVSSEDADNGDKTPAPFRNVYQRGDKKDNEGLYISKKMTGNMSSGEDSFTFTITATKNKTETLTSYIGTIYNNVSFNDDGTVNLNNASETTTKYTVTLDGKETTFTLGENQALVFPAGTFPVGTSYTVTESANDLGYTPNYTLKSGTVQDFTTSNTEVGAELSANTVVRVGDNYVNYVNHKGDNTVFTGIVTDNLSFILLIGVAVAGMAAYVVMKRRLRNF